MTKEDIKLKKPKTCSHCAAHLVSMTGRQLCTLGYLTEKVPIGEAYIWRHWSTWENLVVRIKPGEPCPKPTNTNQCVDIRKVIDVHRYYRVDSPEYKKMYNL